jgi:hypothetical protein
MRNYKNSDKKKGKESINKTKNNHIIMEKIRLLGLFFVLLFAINASALNYTVFEHTINIQIDTESQDTVVERFYINFLLEKDKIAFREKSFEMGTDIEKWKEFNSAFASSLGENTSNKKISYNEGEVNYLEISYLLSEPLMAKGKEAEMLTEYRLKVNYFNEFYQSGLWIIPENTKVTVELPPGAEIRETIEPQATIGNSGTRKAVVWQGYRSANKLALSYVLWKKIEPVVDLNALVGFLLRTGEGQILLIALIAAIIIIIWQRKKIVEVVEDFVENNSVLKEE